MPIDPAIQQAGRYEVAAAVASALITSQGLNPASCLQPNDQLAQAVKVQTDNIVAKLDEGL